MAEIFWPFDPSIINYGFGYPPGYGGFHNGIDFPVPQGTQLRATASGTVRNVDAGQADGAGVDIITSDGWKVRMWHVSKFLVPNGTPVSAGDVVALSGGARGTWGAGNSTGAHLHWGTMVNNAWVDPAGLNPQFFDKPQPVTNQRKQRDMMFVIVKETGVGVVIGEYSILEINPKTDPVEFAASEAIWGAGMNRVFITAEQLRIEKLQLDKRRKSAPGV